MKKLLIFLFSLMSISHSALADITVLVHGFLGSPTSWDRSLISRQLEAAGWNRAGVIFQTPEGAMLSQQPGQIAGNEIYRVDLPSRAPLMFQANQLQNMISDLEKRHVDEDIVIIGHSAGGVVARAKLVKFGAGNVKKLITIASPHSGTGLALYALNKTHGSGPFGIVKSVLGGEKYHIARSSTGLLLDLVPPHPGSMLFWLNQQPHPALEYVSIVRGESFHRNGDDIVPGHSQDMNNVPALRGKSQVYFLPTEHSLNPLDGDFLTLLLEDNLKKSKK
jgi:pimeloyl-ACP methyl ester carboxylesterase